MDNKLKALVFVKEGGKDRIKTTVIYGVLIVALCVHPSSDYGGIKEKRRPPP